MHDGIHAAFLFLHFLKAQTTTAAFAHCRDILRTDFWRQHDDKCPSQPPASPDLPCPDPAAPRSLPGADADFQSDDLGLDFTDLSSISGFLMNEVPDSTGHFYPPWVAEPEPIVKGEPMMLAENDTIISRQQQQQALARAVPTPGATLDVRIGGVGGGGGGVRGVGSGGGVARALKVEGGAGATFRKTAAGGVTRRRSSSKEEQAKKRRERNRVLARRTRLRKKFFFQSLQQQV